MTRGIMAKVTLEMAGFCIAIAAAGFAGWSAWEAHAARIEAKEAIEAAQRSAAAAEQSNALVSRVQSSYLLPSIQRNGTTASVNLRNVSSNIALDVRAGYFLYTGPLKEVAAVSGKLVNLQLRPLTLALGGNTDTTIIDSLLTVDNKTQEITIQVPVVHGFNVSIGTKTLVTEVQIPSHTLVVGLASFEDSLNVHHTATFCFPLNAIIQDEECAKLNSLQLQSTEANGS